MIYTITMNPSIDYLVALPEFVQGEVNRTKWENISPGGKGLNVSMVLKNLGRDSVAMGFIAGFIGEQIEKYMENTGVTTDFIRVENGLSRINVKIKADVESEINGMGPVLEPSHIQQLFAKLEQVQPEDIVVMAGSLPKNVDGNLYGRICEYVNKKGAKTVIDTSGQALETAVLAKPFLVKPNVAELEQMMGMEITTDDEIVFGGKALLEMGAEHVIISCGKDGAVFIDKNQTIWQRTMEISPVSTVGSGDALVAGFLDGWLGTGDWQFALREGVASGTAGAFSEGLADKEQIMYILKKLSN